MSTAPMALKSPMSPSPLRKARRCWFGSAPAASTLAAEYVLSEGNPNVVLCERGIRTFSDFTRNTLDLSVVPAVERLSHLPIVVDPSHGTGRRDKVVPMSRASIAAGA